MTTNTQAQDLIASYVREVATRLPRKQQHDVACELRLLLVEELGAKAEASGRPPDAVLAAELLAAFGRPADVAARYGVVAHVIDPSDARALRVIAIGGVVAVSVMSWVATRRGAPPDASLLMTLQVWWIRTLLFGALWTGFLATCFALAAWVRRTFPHFSGWKPRVVDRDRANRVGTAFGVPLAGFFIAAYISPRVVVDWLTGGRFNTSWADYTVTFQRGLLPLLLTVMAAHLMLFVWVAVRGRWQPLTRRIDVGFSLAITAILAWVVLDGAMFQTPDVDRVVKQALGLTVLIIVPGVAVQLYREWRRLAEPVRFSEARS